MDTKDNNSKGLSMNDPLNWKSLGFFTAEEYLLYVFKKTEKIASALYLVSGLLKDEEPIKWELRDKGMDLLNSSLGASSTMPGDKNAVIQSLFSAAFETISLLNVAKVSNLISEMNHRILVREIDQIVSLLRDKLVASAENAGYILSDSFFKTPDMSTSGFKDANNSPLSNDGKSKNISSARTRVSSQDLKGHSDVQEKKTQRQEAILSTLKDHPNLSIKDFVKVIKDVSEKTIQRELLDLVDRGLVKKEGERRWSRYSLKQA